MRSSDVVNQLRVAFRIASHKLIPWLYIEREVTSTNNRTVQYLIIILYSGYISTFAE